MKLNINGNEIELVYSFRSNIYFEQITGASIDFTKMTSNDVMMLFYCVVVASLQKAKQPIITLLDFMDAIDDDGGEQKIAEFGDWYVKQLQQQYEILSNTEQETKETNVSGPQGAKKKKV